MNGFINQASKVLMLDSYSAFVANVNTDSLDSAFGKNNEAFVHDLGQQLAMYAWFNGTDKASSPFTNLITKNTFAECLSSQEALPEILTNSHIVSLIRTSPYAKTLYDNTDLGKAVAYLAGLDPDDYADMAAVAASSTAMAAVIASETAMTVVTNSETAMTAIAASETAINAVIASSTAMTAVIASSAAIDSIIKTDVALYYISQNTTALSSLASSIENTTTILWESDLKWQTIYDTLNASVLFTKSGLLTDTGGTKNRSGNLITLIESTNATNTMGSTMSITPAYTGCYEHSYVKNWYTGKHIMWGGHTSVHYSDNVAQSYVEHYMFAPIV